MNEVIRLYVRRPKTSTVVKTTLCFSCCALLWFVGVTTFSCSNSSLDEFIASVCESYKNGQLEGNLCSFLCSGAVPRNAHCHPNHRGKDIVFSVQWNATKVIVKAKKSLLTSYERVYEEENGKRRYPSTPEFLGMVNENLNYVLHKNIVLTEDDIFVNGINPTPAGMNTVFALLQQNEYLFTWALQNTNTVPKIMGVCGHAYAVEFLRPLKTSEPFRNRAKIALDLLKTVAFLSTTMDEGIQQCDMKVDHFGIDCAGNVKITDLDALSLHSTVQRNIAATGSCSSNKDCDYFDCSGHCTSEQCDALLLDNNLQRVCSNIFMGRLLGRYSGLLAGAPDSIASELTSTLETCMGKPGVLVTANETALIQEKLQGLLQRSLPLE
ncbi:divergent protein kinase domain 1C-like [Ornithodoros turicata]|uniref:divergent protein kinase domain 1C-like n=1 Tax=Ornithodoros turicata TaxID=34597 RepID=UPI003138E609